MSVTQRRHFLRSSAAIAAAAASTPFIDRLACLAAAADEVSRAKMRFGLVTYMWGADWDLPTLLKNCERTGALGVELRTTQAHGVEPRLNAAERLEVKKRFADSPVTLVGLGSNEDFHDVDPASLRASIESVKAFIKLSHDVGGSGVKVKPNDLPMEVAREMTIEQIGRALNELGTYAADFDQDVRLEVHGQCAPLPIIAAIMEVADHPRVGVCWNSNPQDLEGEGLEHNFRLVEKRLGKTTHVRQLDGNHYPFAKLIQLLKGIDYEGWLLLEASDKQEDRVAALEVQRKVFDKLVQQ